MSIIKIKLFIKSKGLTNLIILFLSKIKYLAFLACLLKGLIDQGKHS